MAPNLSPRLATNIAPGFPYIVEIALDAKNVRTYLSRKAFVGLFAFMRWSFSVPVGR